MKKFTKPEISFKNLELYDVISTSDEPTDPPKPVEKKAKYVFSDDDYVEEPDSPGYDGFLGFLNDILKK